MLAVVLAAALAQAVQPLVEVDHALSAGRYDQARTMIAAAINAGQSGPEVDRLLAELAFGTGEYALALGRYEALLLANPTNGQFAERAGIAAFRTGNLDKAERLLDRAVALPAPSWRAWNARGVVADHRGEWEVAERAYARAIALAPASAEVRNNIGWSLLLQGAWQQAAGELAAAAALDPQNTRIADNLELARAALSADLPRRRPGESDGDWAARLNDAGVMASFKGDKARAMAAFAQAIEARSTWFDRAANNLARTEGRQ